MNICAVRTIEIYGGDWPTRTDTYYRPLPHEPKSEHRFIIALKELPMTAGRVHYLGDYAECKHCNSIFAVEDQS